MPSTYDITRAPPPPALCGLPAKRERLHAELDAMGPNDRVAEIVRYCRALPKPLRDLVRANLEE